MGVECVGGEVVIVKDVRVEVVKQEGRCKAGHRVGDQWVCGERTVDGICALAYASMYPMLWALSACGRFSWASADGSIEIACPDGDNPVVFSLSAVKE